MKALIPMVADYLGIALFCFCFMQAAHFGWVLAPEQTPFLSTQPELEQHRFWIVLTMLIGLFISLDELILSKRKKQ